MGGWSETDNRAISVRLNLTGTATGTELGNIEFKKHLSSKDEIESNPAAEKEKKIYRSLALCGTLFQVVEFLTSITSHCNSLHQKPLWLNSLKVKN